MCFHTLDGRLTLAEYDLFQDFVVRALLIHLVRNDKAGAATVPLRLAQPLFVPTYPDPLMLPYGEQPVAVSVLLRDIAANPLPWLRDLGRWLFA